MLNEYTPTKWEDNSVSYGAETFNNFETGIKDVTKYVRYAQKQTHLFAEKMKKLQLLYPFQSVSEDTKEKAYAAAENKIFKIAMCGDSVWFGYNTLKSTGSNDPFNPTVANPSNDLEVQDPSAIKIPGRKIGKSSTSIRKSKIRAPEVFIEKLNELNKPLPVSYKTEVGIQTDHVNRVQLVNQIYTGDDAEAAYARWTASKADLWMCNLGINDASADFVHAPYKGNPEMFLDYYSRLIERELDAGTPCVIVTPVQQTQAASYDVDKRQDVQVYYHLLKMIGKLYNIPVIDGSEMNRNFSNIQTIDFTHMTNEGNRTLGCELAAAFMGGDPSDPLTVKDGQFLTSRVQQDNISVKGQAYIEYSPHSPVMQTLLNSPDLYADDKGAQPTGLSVFLNPPKGKVSWDSSSNSYKGDTIPNLTNYIYTDILWRQCDLTLQKNRIGGVMQNNVAEHSYRIELPFDEIGRKIGGLNSEVSGIENTFTKVDNQLGEGENGIKMSGLTLPEACYTIAGANVKPDLILTKISDKKTVIRSLSDINKEIFAEPEETQNKYQSIYWKIDELLRSDYINMYNKLVTGIKTVKNKETGKEEKIEVVGPSEVAAQEKWENIMDVNTKAYNGQKEFLEARHESDEGKVYWNFYCPEDNMIIIPELLTYCDLPQQEEFTPSVTVQLDFGARQGALSNINDKVENVSYETITNPNSEVMTFANLELVNSSSIYPETTLRISETIPASSQPKEFTEITFLDKGSQNKRFFYSGKNNKAKVHPIHISSKGWHSIKITSSNYFEIFGLNVMSLDSYKNFCRVRAENKGGV